IILSINIFSQNIEPNWESIKSRPYPQWFSDAKLGIFIHWGLYSVPAYCGKEQYGEWYLKGMMEQTPFRMEFHNRVFGENFEYRDFDKLFKAELFDADEWADIFKRSGAKYVLLVSKHHDGYCLWDSEYAPNWNSVVGGPKRNIVDELTNSVRRNNMKMGYYYSLPEWNNPLHVWTKDPHDSIGNYVEKHMIPQFKELVSRYKPSVIFADGEWFNTAEQWHAAELISWYYNTVGEEAIVNDRWGEGADYGFRTPEYSAGITQTDRPWAECRGLGRSFGLNRNEPLENYISSEDLIKHFAKLVAAGGGLTLNVGPAADGKIPLLQQERLIDLGIWLETNGEAIYATKPFSKFYEMKDVSVSRIDENIDFNWVRNSPDPEISYDDFTAKWIGYIVPEFSEEYTFEVIVDDAAKILIDNDVIIDFDKNITNTSESNAQEGQQFNSSLGKKKLIAGKPHKITINYQENNLEASIKLFWSSPSVEKEIVPSSNFFLKPDKLGNGLNVIYESEKPTLCYTVKDNNLYAICLDFPDDELILSIDKPSKDMRVVFLDNDSELKWKFNRGKLIIDTSSIKFSDIKSIGAWTFKLENYFINE
ncbi:alpha-L-fucosidase, partial [Bacteroidales bacterium OttesenSCG-928-K03]|nr:alpha-L-fucosidase [Bacteroidales bacterium OttesenSCG-928-K03]